MIKYKVIYSYVGNSLDIYFQSKNREINKSYITLFILEWTNDGLDNRLVNLDNIINRFYKINIYADLISDSVYFGKASIGNLSDYVNSNNFKTLNYESVLDLYNFITNNKKNRTFDSYNFKFSTLIKYPKDVIVNITESTLLFWDDDE